jgi:HAD superfamily hydrolase (TIGR01509 family)
MKKAYIFDLDGTLVDSMTCGWVEMLTGFLSKRGIAYPDDLVKTVIPLGTVGCAKYYREEYGVKESVEEIVAIFQETLREKYENEILAKPNAEQVLNVLKSNGASLNVLTASQHVFLDPCLKRWGLLDLFVNVWSVEDFALTKADEEIYQAVADRLGEDIRDCIIVDDSIAVLQVAKRSGIQTIGFFDDFSADMEEEMRKTADKYVYDFMELVEN